MLQTVAEPDPILFYLGPEPNYLWGSGAELLFLRIRSRIIIFVLIIIISLLFLFLGFGAEFLGGSGAEFLGGIGAEFFIFEDPEPNYYKILELNYYGDPEPILFSWIRFLIFKGTGLYISVHPVFNF